MKTQTLQGLVAATYTPLHDNGSLHLEPISPYVDRLIEQGIAGLYVCGSTGEGMSLSGAERKAVAEAYVDAAVGRVPVIVQVGHNSLAEARELAAHAQQIGANAISATCPSYFKVESVELLVECMQKVAAGAPDVPFYYYHIPTLTGSQIDMEEFLRCRGDRIPSFVGIKFTDPTLHHFQRCLEFEDGRFDIVWGCDEMLLGALATGARAAIGSTYNIAAPLYRRLIDSFQRRDLEEARRLQSLSVSLIKAIGVYPFHPAMKQVLGMLGLDFGPCRLPLRPISPMDAVSLNEQLKALGFFEWNSMTPFQQGKS